MIIEKYKLEEGDLIKFRDENWIRKNSIVGESFVISILDVGSKKERSMINFNPIILGICGRLGKIVKRLNKNEAAYGNNNEQYIINFGKENYRVDSVFIEEIYSEDLIKSISIFCSNSCKINYCNECLLNKYKLLYGDFINKLRNR